MGLAIRELPYNYLLGRHALGEMYAPQGRVTHYFSVGSRIPPKYKIVMGEIDFRGRKIPFFFFAPKAQFFFLPLYFAPKARIFFWCFLGSNNKDMGGVPPWTSEIRPTHFDVRPDFGGTPLWGVIGGPPSRKHDLGELPGS